MGCSRLSELPKNMRKLINLFCLDIRGTSLRDMPPQMGQLSKLQTLTNFIVRIDGGSGINELGKLLLLKGELSIEIRHKFVHDEDAREAPISNLEQLNTLKLEWVKESMDSIQARNELEKLRPRTKLESLSIINYRGSRFPEWLTRHPNSEYPDWSNLVCLKLTKCENCPCLPSLGHLASPRDLEITGFGCVKSVGSEFYATTTLQQPFPSLQILSFANMWSWQKGENKEGAFLNLKELYIQDCPNLREAVPSELPRLSKLDIRGCDRLVLMLPKVGDKCEMKLSEEFGHLKLVKSSFYCQHLSVHHSVDLLHKISGFSAVLQEIEFGYSYSLVCFPLESIPETKTLRILGCPNLQSFLATETTSGEDFMLPCQHLHLIDCKKASLAPLLRSQTISTVTLELKSLLNMRFVKLPSGFHCLQIRWLSNEAALEQKLKYDCASTVQEIEIRKKHVNYSPPLELFAKVKCIKIVDRHIPGHDPSEMGDPADFTNLKSLEVLFCNDLLNFPKGLPARNLTSLALRNCKKLKYLPEHMQYLFPALRKLEIVGCSELQSISRVGLPFTKDEKSMLAETLFPATLTFLKLMDLPNVLSLDLKGLGHLTQLTIGDCPELQSITEPECTQLAFLPSLTNLIIYGCPQLDVFLEGGLPSKLQVLYVARCQKLVAGLMQCDLRKLPSLSSLTISDYHQLEFLPEDTLLPSTLTYLHLWSLQGLKSVGLLHLTSLQTLMITECSQLQSLPKEELASTLQFLCIYDCPLLKREEEWQKISHIPKIKWQ